MAKALRVAMEIVDICNKSNYELDYMKLQKLTCLCNLVHYSKHQVPLSPEKMYYWSLGPSFKEIYAYFYKINSIDKNIVVRNINKIKHSIGDLLLFEKETINYVIEKYANKDFEELYNLCMNDELYNKIEYGDIIELHKLNDCYKNINENYSLKRTLR